MAALIVFDLNGGDAVYHLVDNDLWEQILEIQESFDKNNNFHKNKYKFQETVCYLTCDEVDFDPGMPKPKGKVLGTWHTQTYVAEKVDFQNYEVNHIMTFPAV